jgi:hypothetical protein
VTALLIRVPLLVVAAASFACQHELRATARDDAATVAVGRKPIDLAAGDLDGDGRLDLVSADADERAISVRLYGGQDWLAAPSLATGFQAHLVALGDVDGDGGLDVVATGHDSGAVGLWLGDGKGGFAAAPGSPFPAFAVDAPHNHGLALGDLDGDRDADVVVADQDRRAVVVLRSEGGALHAGAPIPVGGQPYPPVLGDVDGDGDLDLVAPLLDTHAIAVLLGDGRGGFAHAPGSPHRTARDRPYAVAVADVDRDGTLDVVAPHDDTDEISVLLGVGGGRLREAPGSPVRAGLRIWRPALADLDGDGALDIAGAGSGSVVRMRGDGHGGFAQAHRHATRGWAVVVADLAGDRRPEIATPDPEAAVLRIVPGW